MASNAGGHRAPCWAGGQPSGVLTVLPGLPRAFVSESRLHVLWKRPRPSPELGSGAPSCCHQRAPGLGQRRGLADPSRQRLWPQEAAHEGLMCRRQAREARIPEPLRRHRSLTARSLLPMAEKQRRALRDLRRLEGLGLVSAEDGYQGLLDELAKVRARARHACAQERTCARSAGTSLVARAPPPTILRRR